MSLRRTDQRNSINRGVKWTQSVNLIGAPGPGATPSSGGRKYQRGDLPSAAKAKLYLAKLQAEVAGNRVMHSEASANANNVQKRMADAGKLRMAVALADETAVNRDLRHELNNRHRKPNGFPGEQLRRVRRLYDGEEFTDPNYVPNTPADDSDVLGCYAEIHDVDRPLFDFLAVKLNALEVWALTTPTAHLDTGIAKTLMQGQVRLDCAHCSPNGVNAFFCFLFAYNVLRDAVSVNSTPKLNVILKNLRDGGMQCNHVCKQLGSCGNFIARMFNCTPATLEYFKDTLKVDFSLAYDRIPNKLYPGGGVWSVDGVMTNCSPLHVAAYNRGESFVTALCPFSDVNAKSSTGDTALHIASARGSKGIVDSLIAAKADINARNAKLETPLLAVAKHAQAQHEFIQYLLQLPGVDMQAIDEDGRGVDHYITIRKQSGAQVLQVIDGQTALDTKFKLADVTDCT